jgi:PAS domain S-box-containing protein
LRLDDDDRGGVTMARATKGSTDRTDLKELEIQQELARRDGNGHVGLLGAKKELGKAKTLKDAYGSIVRGIADPMFVADKDLTVVYMNEACAEASGYSAEEAVGKMKCEQVFNSDICRTNCALKHCMATRETITGTKVTITNRSGQEIPVLCSASPLMDDSGEVIGGMEMVRDITEDVEREREVKNQEEYANSIVRGISDPFFVVDRDLVVTYMNQACADATGYSIDEVVGKMRCQQVFNADICNTDCAIKKCMATGETLSGARVNITNRSGQQIPIMVSAAAIYDAEGNVLGGYELARDMSKEAEIERQLLDAAEQLSSASEQVAAGTNETSTVADQVAQGVQGIASEMEAVTAASARCAEVASAGQEAVQRAVERMETISSASNEMVEGMRELNTKSVEIGQITEVITSVAEQTNLLALNAAIEAARAGEHGKGFAVVAEEVRKLAEQAASATGQITQLLKGIQDLVDSRTKQMEETATDVQEGAAQVGEMSSAFTQVSEAIGETDVRSQNVSATTQELSASSEEMSATFEEIVASTEELTSLAESLQETASQLGK